MLLQLPVCSLPQKPVVVEEKLGSTSEAPGLPGMGGGMPGMM